MIGSSVEILVAIMVEVVLQPVGIVKINDTLVRFNALHFVIDIIGDRLQAA